MSLCCVLHFKYVHAECYYAECHYAECHDDVVVAPGSSLKDQGFDSSSPGTCATKLGSAIINSVE
jgi:hypothetical protein